MAWCLCYLYVSWYVGLKHFVAKIAFYLFYDLL